MVGESSFLIFLDHKPLGEYAESYDPSFHTNLSFMPSLHQKMCAPLAKNRLYRTTGNTRACKHTETHPLI